MSDTVTPGSGQVELINVRGARVLPVTYLPFTAGNIWHVRPRTGSDSNTGLRPDRAFKTLAQAQLMAIANQNDIVLLYAEGNASGNTSGTYWTTDYQSTTLTWAKDMVHLFGVNAGSRYHQRSRIAQLATATGVSPLLDITGNGCRFQDLEIFHGVNDATSLICTKVEGTGNKFVNCQIAGAGNAAQVTAGSYASLQLYGAIENTFQDCAIGLTTIARDNTGYGEIYCTANASGTACARNVFIDCDIDAYISNASYVFMTIAANGSIDRKMKFKNCVFSSNSVNRTIHQTQAFSLPATMAQGIIELQNTYAYSDGGAVVWVSSGKGTIFNNSVAAAASAAGGIMTVL